MICNVCKEDKDESSFATDNRKPGRKRLTCKPCSNERAKLWREVNKERATETRLIWRHNNRARHLFKKSEYRAMRAKAQPVWITDEHRKQMHKVYWEATMLTRRTGIEHQVDHIHPIRGLNFTGLHVPWNLQVLTYKDNALKSNKLPPEDEHLAWSEPLVFKR